MFNSPITFESSATADGAYEKPWRIQSGAEEALCGIPTQFNGFAGGFSPEDLYLQALINCFIGTFKVYAKASGLPFTKLNVAGNLTVDKDEAKKTMMKSCHLDIEIHGSDRPDRIGTVVAKVFKDGFILSSVKTHISYSLALDGVVFVKAT